MRYGVSVTIELESRRDGDGVARQFASLFDFGTIKESIADGLRLQSEPKLLHVSVQRKPRDRRNR
jgi:hypothetical protein